MSVRVSTWRNDMTTRAHNGTNRVAICAQGTWICDIGLDPGEAQEVTEAHETSAPPCFPLPGLQDIRVDSDPDYHGPEDVFKWICGSSLLRICTIPKAPISALVPYQLGCLQPLPLCALSLNHCSHQLRKQPAAQPSVTTHRGQGDLEQGTLPLVRN